MRLVWLAPAGAVVGLVASMCGIGGGLFAVPILHYLYRLELRRSVATSLFLVLATAVAATGAELLRSEPDVRLGVVAALVTGGLVGTQLGYWISRRLSTRALRGVFVVALGAAGARILFGGEAPLGAAAGSALSSLQYAYVAAVGLVGGTIAPLLGIGGGLVFVPALYFGLPEVGFPGARACSLATAVITTSRSGWLYAREGLVERRAAAWLASGAIFGAACGVWVFHQPGWVDVARRALGAILWFVAARFLVDLARDRADRRGADA